jgi:hypothetical protein
VPFDAMPDLYREVAASGGCILSTSVREGLPLTLLEAQACGCTVVASDVPGNNECVSAQHGGTLYPADLEGSAVAALILDGLRDRGAIEARQAAAATYVREEFIRARMAERYLRTYEEAPYPAARDRAIRRRARRRLSPLWNYRGYLEQRWGVGDRQYGSSRVLAQEGCGRLAAGAARASLRTCPTLFLNTERLAHLVRVHLHQPHPTEPPKESERAST